MARPTTVYIDPEKLLRGIHRENELGPAFSTWQQTENWRFRNYGARIDFPAFMGRGLTKTETQKCAVALRDLERQGLVEVWDNIRAMRVKLTASGEARLRELGVDIPEPENGTDGN